MSATKENSVLNVDASDLTRVKILECSVCADPPPHVVKVEDEDEEDESLVIDDNEADENKYEIEEFDNGAGDEDTSENGKFSKRFSKCDKCRASRTKFRVPAAVLSVTFSRNDGITCDFCGNRMTNASAPTLPNVFEGRRGSKGADLLRKLNKRGETNPTEKDVVDAMRKKNKSYAHCGECGKGMLKASLKKHRLDVHENANKRQCHICSKVIASSAALEKHISAVHEKVTEHECPHCQHRFAHHSNMQRHIRLLHDREVETCKYVSCDACGKVVQSRCLKRHMLAVHDNRRDYVCSYCSKAFGQSYTLKEHVIAKHTHNFCYTCSFCQKECTHRTNACRHVRTVHKDQVDGTSLEGDIIKKYVNYHEIKRDFVCSHCDKGFAQSDTLKEHVKAKHSVCYTCSFCQKEFGFSKSACRHVRTLHKDQIDGTSLDGDMIKKYVMFKKTDGLAEEEVEIKVKIELAEDAS